MMHLLEIVFLCLVCVGQILDGREVQPDSDDTDWNAIKEMLGRLQSDVVKKQRKLAMFDAEHLLRLLSEKNEIMWYAGIHTGENPGLSVGRAEYVMGDSYGLRYGGVSGALQEGPFRAGPVLVNVSDSFGDIPLYASWFRSGSVGGTNLREVYRADLPWRTIGTCGERVGKIVEEAANADVMVLVPWWVSECELTRKALRWGAKIRIEKTNAFGSRSVLLVITEELRETAGGGATEHFLGGRGGEF